MLVVTSSITTYKKANDCVSFFNLAGDPSF